MKLHHPEGVRFSTIVPKGEAYTTPNTEEIYDCENSNADEEVICIEEETTAA